MDPHFPRSWGAMKYSTPRGARNCPPKVLSGRCSRALRGRSPGLVVEEAVAVAEEHDALDVGLGFVEGEPIDEPVELRIVPCLAPQTFDSIRPAVVAGQRQFDVAVEHVQDLANIESPEADVVVGVRESIGRVSKPEAASQFPARGWHHLHQPPGSSPALGGDVKGALLADHGEHEIGGQIPLSCPTSNHLVEVQRIVETLGVLRYRRLMGLPQGWKGTDERLNAVSSPPQ